MLFRLYRARFDVLDAVAATSDPKPIAAGLRRRSKEARSAILQLVDLGSELARLDRSQWLSAVDGTCACIEPALFESFFNDEPRDFPEVSAIFFRPDRSARRAYRIDDDLGGLQHVTARKCQELASKMAAVDPRTRAPYVRSEWRSLCRAVSKGAAHADGLLAFSFAD